MPSARAASAGVILVGDEEERPAGPFGERVERRRGPAGALGENGAGFGVEGRNRQAVARLVERAEGTAPPRSVRPDAPGDGEEEGTERPGRGRDEAARTAQQEDEEILDEIPGLVPVTAMLEEGPESRREAKGFLQDRLDRGPLDLIPYGVHAP
ncbi:MAG: hypothetical protein IPF66_22415 [Holophagales bacterium]|nr:hypothetical protein [Holophagales bacterium]